MGFDEHLYGNFHGNLYTNRSNTISKQNVYTGTRKLIKLDSRYLLQQSIWKRFNSPEIFPYTHPPALSVPMMHFRREIATQN